MRFATSIFCFLTLLHSILVKLTSASDTVLVHFYTEFYCDTPSILTPNASIALGVCAATPGLLSFNAEGVSCASGNLKIWAYGDSTCGNEISPYSPNDCWNPGYPHAVAALLIGCGASPPPVTAATTYSVGDVITQAPASSATATATQNPAATTGTSSNGNGGTSASTDSGSGWSSLTYGEKVGIIVALAMGLPCILFAWLTYRFMVRHGH